MTKASNTQTQTSKGDTYTTRPFQYPARDKLHRTFGGCQCSRDYEVGNYHSMCDIASRIARNVRFDEQCRKNIERTKSQKDYWNDEQN